MEHELVRKEITGGSEVAITANRVLGCFKSFSDYKQVPGRGLCDHEIASVSTWDLTPLHRADGALENAGSFHHVNPLFFFSEQM